MKTELVTSSLLSALLFSFQWASTRILSIVLKPVVRLMIRFCMPPFVSRFMMQ